jgi:transposase
MHWPSTCVQETIDRRTSNEDAARSKLPLQFMKHEIGVRCHQFANRRLMGLGDDQYDPLIQPGAAWAASGRSGFARPLEDIHLRSVSTNNRTYRPTRYRRCHERHRLPRLRRTNTRPDAFARRHRHHGQPPELQSCWRARAIEARGAKLVYLPPYSPDFNPIEQAFGKLKALLRMITARTGNTLWDALGDILDRFTPQECSNYLANAGYAPVNRNLL